MYTLISPFKVPLSKKKNFALNLNVYRNAHYLVLDNAKKSYKRLMRNQIKKLPFFDYQISLRIVIYPPTRRKFDVGNIGSITEKFFLDALTEFGKLADDSYEYCPEVSYTFGSVSSKNPRVEIHMKRFNVDTKIDINFTEDQIKAILIDAISEEMPHITVNEITFISKRNPAQISASVDASMAGVEEPEQTPKPESKSESVGDYLDLD